MLPRYIILIVFICFSLSGCAADNDFDAVCGIFKELRAKSDLDQLSRQQRAAFVTDKINKNLHTSSAARIAWEAIAAAEPSQRYELFKGDAEEVTGKSWDCEAMQKLASTAGDW
jgi:hypothetical protein